MGWTRRAPDRCRRRADGALGEAAVGFVARCRIRKELAIGPRLPRLSRVGRCGMIEYPIGASGQVVALTAQPLAHFAAHRQTSWWHREAGGQLFARFNDTRIVVELATGP